MDRSTIISVIFAILTILVVGAWIGGYLDRYQKIAQDKALDAMGENRASYGVKQVLTSENVSDDKDLTNLQEDVANTAGGLVGKGGIGESIGAGLSKGL